MRAFLRERKSREYIAPGRRGFASRGCRERGARTGPCGIGSLDQLVPGCLVHCSGDVVLVVRGIKDEHGCPRIQCDAVEWIVIIEDYRFPKPPFRRPTEEFVEGGIPALGNSFAECPCDKEFDEETTELPAP